MSYKELITIAGGKYAKRLDFLRWKAAQTPAEEFYLLLNPSEVRDIAQAHFAIWATRLEAFRNGLILLPLLVTWLSLCLAALAYIKTYSLSADPFLKQWADGFPKSTLLFVPSFVGVAAFDALLVFFLLILTVAIQTIEGGARKRADALRSWLDEELFTLASSSFVKSLGEGPDNKQPAWAVEVHTAINHLTQALTGVEILVQTSQQILQNLVQTSQATFQNLMSASQEKLEGSVREFRGAIGDQREAVEKFMSGTIEVRRAVDKLELIYTEGEHIYRGLNTTLPKIDESFRNFSTRQDAAATALESLSGQTSQSTQAVSSIATQFAQIQFVENIQQASQEMQQSVAMMAKIANSMENTVNQQIKLQIHLDQQDRTTSTPKVKPARKSWFPFFR